MYQRYKNEGLTIVAADMGEPVEKVKHFVDQHRLSFPHVLDQEAKAAEDIFYPGDTHQLSYRSRWTDPGRRSWIPRLVDSRSPSAHPKPVGHVRTRERWIIYDTPPRRVVKTLLLILLSFLWDVTLTDATPVETDRETEGFRGARAISGYRHCQTVTGASAVAAGLSPAGPHRRVARYS